MIKTKKKKIVRKKVKNIVVNGHTTQPRRMLTSTKRCWLSAEKTKKICQKKSKKISNSTYKTEKLT